MPTGNSKAMDFVMPPDRGPRRPKKRLGFAPKRRFPQSPDTPRCLGSCELPPLTEDRRNSRGCLLFFFLLFGVAGFLWAACCDIRLAFGILAGIAAVMGWPTIRRRGRCAICRMRNKGKCRRISPPESEVTFAEFAKTLGVVFWEGLKWSFLVIVVITWVGFHVLVMVILLLIILDSISYLLGGRRDR